MKIYKFSIFLVLITFVALVYVHQQVQLLKVSYKLNSNERETSRLLDQNKMLVYNVSALKSPVYLDNKFLATKKDYVIPKQWQVIEVATQRQDRQPAAIAKLEKKSFKIFKIFGKPREAMANPIK